MGMLVYSASLSTLAAVFHIINEKCVHPPHCLSCNKRKNKLPMPIYWPPKSNKQIFTITIILTFWVPAIILRVLNEISTVMQ